MGQQTVFNNKIKVLKRIFYRIRNLEYFRTRIYHWNRCTVNFRKSIPPEICSRGGYILYFSLSKSSFNPSSILSVISFTFGFPVLSSALINHTFIFLHDKRQPAMNCLLQINLFTFCCYITALIRFNFCNVLLSPFSTIGVKYRQENTFYFHLDSLSSFFSIIILHNVLLLSDKYFSTSPLFKPYSSKHL